MTGVTLIPGQSPLQGTVVQILLRFWCIEVMLLVYVVGIVAGQASTPGLQ